jgi:hypothetical protein
MSRSLFAFSLQLQHNAILLPHAKAVYVHTCKRWQLSRLGRTYLLRDILLLMEKAAKILYLETLKWWLSRRYFTKTILDSINISTTNRHNFRTILVRNMNGTSSILAIGPAECLYTRYRVYRSRLNTRWQY